jgi:Icc-related predicted phosphoesterase
MALKFLVLADLHLDIWEESRRDPLAGLEDEFSSLDLLILAGDLTNKPKVRWAPALQRLKSLMPNGEIAIFPGNHDFYQFRLDDENRLREIAKATGVQYCNAGTLQLGGTRFLCATLWTDYELGPGRLANEAHIPTRMNDFRAIRIASDGYRKPFARDFVQKHLAHKSWLASALAGPFDGRTMVVTHHAPHPGVLAPYAEGLDAAYASNLEDFILEHAPDEWLFGHCHDANEITVGKTLLRNVSLGYPGEVPDPGTRIRHLIRTL